MTRMTRKWHINYPRRTLILYVLDSGVIIVLILSIQGIIIQGASMAYQFNQQKNVLQKYLSIYMQAQHLSKSAFVLLQQARITMSYP
jgi:hypothetical protein